MTYHAFELSLEYLLHKSGLEDYEVKTTEVTGLTCIVSRASGIASFIALYKLCNWELDEGYFCLFSLFFPVTVPLVLTNYSSLSSIIKVKSRVISLAVVCFYLVIRRDNRCKSRP